MQDSENSQEEFNQTSGVTKHVILRGGFLLLTLLFMFFRAAYTGNGWWVLISLFLGFGFAVVWFFFILIEGFILYSKKKNNVANINMIMIVISLLISGIMFFYIHH